MKNCPNCQAEVADKVGTCWKCGYDFIAANIEANSKEVFETSDLKCLRCETNMEYRGKQQFHEGKRYGILGDIGELFVNKTILDMYVCPSCKKVEFFVGD